MNKSIKKVRALVMLSGGLDSMLAAKALQSQDIEVVGICFISNFFDCQKAEAAAQNLGIRLIVQDLSAEVLDLVKNPPHGHGKNLNPCIDCHALMLRTALAHVKPGRAENVYDRFDFIATGEVLGQRPFSQNKSALGLVLKTAGTDVLRPLSAQLLPETEIEKSGLVDRNRLLAIQGRNREKQFELAQEYGLVNYPRPAGGCLLTDPDFASRLLKMLEYWPECQPADAELLKHGRAFWFNSGNNTHILAVIGRNAADNGCLAALAKKGDFMVELIEEAGPTGLIRGFAQDIVFGNFTEYVPLELDISRIDENTEKNSEDIVRIVKLLNCYYAPRLRGKEVKVKVKKIS